MMKQEFEKLIDSEIDQETYKKVETVYVNYPGIEDKQQIADIYKIGMHLIEDMLIRANEIKSIESERANMQRRLYELGVK
jgi:hypothetical protein